MVREGKGWRGKGVEREGGGGEAGSAWGGEGHFNFHQDKGCKQVECWIATLHVCIFCSASELILS